MVAAQRHVIHAARHMHWRLARQPCLPGLRDPACMMIATVAAWQPAIPDKMCRNAIVQIRFRSPALAALAKLQWTT